MALKLREQRQLASALTADEAALEAAAATEREAGGGVTAAMGVGLDIGAIGLWGVAVTGVVLAIVGTLDAASRL